MGYKVNKHLCVVALARTTTVVNITQLLQSGKSLDSGLQRLYITLNSLKYNIRIASELQLVRLFPRTLENYIILCNAKFGWMRILSGTLLPGY